MDNGVMDLRNSPANYEIVWDNGDVECREFFQFVEAADRRWKEVWSDATTFSAVMTNADQEVLREFFA